MQPSSSIQDITPTTLLRQLLTERKAKVQGWFVSFEGDEICVTDPKGTQETYFASSLAGCANALKVIQGQASSLRMFGKSFKAGPHIQW
jgi:hypothetical protein